MQEAAAAAADPFDLSRCREIDRDRSRYRSRGKLSRDIQSTTRGGEIITAREKERKKGGGEEEGEEEGKKTLT